MCARGGEGAVREAAIGGKRIMKQLRETFSRIFLPRRHSALLIAIVFAFAARPLLGDNKAALVLFGMALVVTMIVSLYTVQVDELVGKREVLETERRRRIIIGWVLALAAIAERASIFIAPSHLLYVTGSIGWLLFFCYITWTQLRGLLRQRQVTRETISMAVAVYLLLGLTWGLLYIVIFELQPDAFNFEGSSAPTASELTNQPSIIAVLIYFSLTTLATVGYGDITPVTLQARYVAVSEGIAGQFYLAILVARLVAMQLSPPRDQ